MNDLLRIDMGSKLPAIKFQALSGDFPKRPCSGSICPESVRNIQREQGEFKLTR